MNKYFKKCFILSFIFIIVLGTISHFLYEWSNYNKIIGFFVAVNESTWEHIKLALFPALILSIVRLIYVKNNNLLAGMFISLISMIILIPLLFYGYTFLLGHHNVILDITLFIISVFIGEFLFYKVLSINKSLKIYNIYFIIGIILILTSYSLFTFFPIKSFMFEDPVDHIYGINKVEK